MRKKRFCPHRF